MSENHRHDLVSEFPEHKETIHRLKVSNEHFKKLATRYEEIDKSIVRAESRIDLLSEENEEKVRKERLQLKDEIFKMLRESV